MKLKRFLILKLFGKYLDDSDETLFSENTRADAVREIYGGKNPQSRRAMLEIMKIIEMYSHPVLYENTTHWIDKIVEAMSKLISRGVFTPQSVFSVIDWEGGESVVGINSMTKIKSGYSSPESFIEDYVVKQLLTESRGGVVKYSSAISSRADISWDMKDYITIYRYIALCITGQVNPDVVDNIYTKQNREKIMKTEIDYEKSLFTSASNYEINKLKKLIAKCIVNIVGYPNDNIIKYLS